MHGSGFSINYNTMSLCSFKKYGKMLQMLFEINKINFSPTGSRCLQAVKGSPVRGSGQVHVGIWLIT